MSYAYEYLTAHNELDGISDVTLSFLREGRPLKLMKWLEGEGYERLKSPGWVARYKKSGCSDRKLIRMLCKWFDTRELYE